jgi:hypothetical protein
VVVPEKGILIMVASKLRPVLALAALLLAAPLFAAPGALSLVPNDAVSVGVVKLNELRTSPLSSMLFQHTDRFGSNGDAAEFLRETGLDPVKDVDVLVVATSPRTALGSDADILVMAEGRFNVARLSKALTDRGAVRKTTAGGAYLTLPDKEDPRGAVSFPSADLAIMGSEASVAKALASRASGGSAFTVASGLGRDAARIDQRSTTWAVVDVARASRLTGGFGHVPGKGAHGEALGAAIKSVSTIALWATDSGDALTLGAFGLATDTETLELLEDTLRGALSGMRLAVKDKAPELVSVLRKFDVDRTKDSVRITGTIPGDQIRKLMAQKTASK